MSQSEEGKPLRDRASKVSGDLGKLLPHRKYGRSSGGDTDVTQCLSGVYWAEPDLRDGSCSIGEPFPTLLAERDSLLAGIWRICPE